MWWHRSKKPDDSVEALRDARANLREVRQRGGEVSEVADFFREFRERNHIAEQLTEIMYRKGGQTNGA